jgi:uncharacterized protein Yka (UPF0111/DUF47 family)
MLLTTYLGSVLNFCLNLAKQLLIIKSEKMKKNANYAILPELGLILECCKGLTMVEDAVSMKKDEIANNLYNPAYNIIVDIQEFETSLDATMSQSISDFFSFLKEVEIRSRIAFLTTKPHQVVFSEIMKGLYKNHSKIEIEVFSTAEAAIRFLGYPADSFDLISNKLTELNKNTG